MSSISYELLVSREGMRVVDPASLNIIYIEDLKCIGHYNFLPGLV
jgi:hypothetical protein